MKQVVAARGCMLAYGSLNKAHIYIRKNQVWNVIAEPCDRFPWYTIRRREVVIDVIAEDYERYFKERGEA